MASKLGVDLAGTFLETIKKSTGTSVAEQLETFKQLTSPADRGRSSISRDSQSKAAEDWGKLLSEVTRADVPPAAPVDPMIVLLGALIQASHPAAASDLTAPTGLNMDRLTDLVARAEKFGFIKLTGTPPRFEITDEGISVFQKSTAK